ncbi:unnamed protein product, partial [marine sediment metagenome]
INVMGIPNQAWLANPKLALPAIMVADIWLYAPFVFLVMFASLQALPQEPMEAARIDGGSRWQIFTRITLPLLVPNFLLIIVIRLMDTFRVFDFIYIMTNGGPGGRTETIGFLSYERPFRHFNMGQGSAVIAHLYIGSRVAHFLVLHKDITKGIIGTSQIAGSCYMEKIVKKGVTNLD